MDSDINFLTFVQKINIYLWRILKSQNLRFGVNTFLIVES